MIKKIYLVSIYILFVILILDCFLEYSYAANGIVYLQSNKENINVGEEVEITIFIENDKTIAFNANIYFDNTKLEYISEIENVNVIENKVVYLWHDNTGGTLPKSGEIAKLKFRAKEEGTAIFQIDGDFYNDADSIIEVNSNTVQLQIGSQKLLEEKNVNEELDMKNNNINLENDNANLEILAIENSLLYPPFDTNVTKYNVEVSNEIKTLNIFAVPENENAKLDIIGNVDLKEGNNSIKVTVIAKNNISKKVYEVNVYKRNQTEQIKFEEEIQENKEKLDEIYQAEKIISEVENINQYNKNNLLQEKEQNSNIGLSILFCILISLLICIIIFRYKKSKKK